MAEEASGWLAEEAEAMNLIPDEDVDSLTRAGWLVVSAHDRVDLCEPTAYLTPGPTRVSLHRLTRIECIYEHGCEPVVLKVPDHRWVVESDGLPGGARTFADFSAAWSLFLKEAYRQRPEPRGIGTGPSEAPR